MDTMRYPVYIPTRGRASRQMTAGILVSMGVRPTLVVEDAEHDAYAAANPGCDVIVWQQSYFDEYEKTPGLEPHPTTGAAHNYAWDHARNAGYSHHWIMDDNFNGFFVRKDAGFLRVDVQTPFTWHEDFIEKWQNLAGICLTMRSFQRNTRPIMVNTRLYCATLYRNDLDQYGIKWRRGLNDDTIVSLDILKTGWLCTAESRMLGIGKLGTSRKNRIAGGMTDFYADGGFLRKSAELVRVHPDCARTEVRFGRIHHVADYGKFKQQLIPVSSRQTVS